MAEATTGFDIRRLLLIGGVVIVVVFSAFFFLFRGCASSPIGARKPGYTLIYSNLDLKDAANVIARLKELTIPYEIREDGRAIAVPKEKTDQARLGLAEKNLPLGGVVGWEIFDQSRLGATDFDRRIQLIRAISGEISRTIRRIEGVEDARVQIVIPETKLFAASVSPVTAAVMLRIRPGVELDMGKINGIVHLVASSVENLQPENVMVIDDTGRILTAKGLAPAAPPAEMAVIRSVEPATSEITAVQEVVSTPEVILKKAALEVKVVTPKASPVTAEVAATPEVVPTPEVAELTKVSTLSVGQAGITPEEKILVKTQAKKDLEQELSGKAQELLNRFYPPNSLIFRAAVEIQPAKTNEITAKDLKIKKIKAVILIDNRIDLTPKLKAATFTTAAAAIGYDKKRGDKIILQLAPFHLATPSFEAVRNELLKEKKDKDALKMSLPYIPFRTLLWVGGIALMALIVLLAVNFIKRSQQNEAPVLVEEEPVASPRQNPPPTRERSSVLDQLKNAAESDPEKIAELLKKWLSE